MYYIRLLIGLVYKCKQEKNLLVQTRTQDTILISMKYSTLETKLTSLSVIMDTQGDYESIEMFFSLYINL